MPETVPIKCPACGNSDGFKMFSQAKTYDDLIGATCTDCGHAISDEEIKRQAADIARQRISDLLKGSKF